MIEAKWCRSGLHDLSAEGARIKDGRCRICNSYYHRLYRYNQSHRRHEPVAHIGLLGRLRAAVGL